MSIPLSPAVPHPTQPGVMLNELAVESMVLSNGSSIDSPASIAVVLKPFTSVMANGVTAYITSSAVPTVHMQISDVYAWVAARAAVNDMQPANAMAALIAAVGAEYARQHP